ncbi:hypothetical protein T4B_15057 [Trichinella pseudospiralis]|uniref:Uncharacterized protein n=1 Tax=Trichinella pseudospiralis TaxID=6337 RepID=A0A0V1GM17_TRIPS|nr:hypothetical protein T4B_15057 [Trichinella pseudospiralis]
MFTGVPGSGEPPVVPKDMPLAETLNFLKNRMPGAMLQGSLRLCFKVCLQLSLRLRLRQKFQNLAVLWAVIKKTLTPWLCLRQFLKKSALKLCFRLR